MCIQESATNELFHKQRWTEYYKSRKFCFKLKEFDYFGLVELEDDSECCMFGLVGRRIRKTTPCN